MSQEPLVRALSDPRTYRHQPGSVEHVQTHISHVFLAGEYVYKLKKAVRFPFLDFSNAALRRHFCEEEVRLNRRLCPSLYLGVVPLTKQPAGGFALGGEGPAVDHLVWMRRLPSDGMMPRLIAEDRVDPAMILDLACVLAEFHSKTPSGPEVSAYASPDALGARWDKEVGAVVDFVGELIAPEDQDVLADFGPSFIRRHETLLRARQHAGRAREGHGDLHSRNICFVRDELPSGSGLEPLPAGFHIFDCLEFSYELRCNDVASEIAFLTMDLESLGRADLAQSLIAAYGEASGDLALKLLVPFYACYRAYVRAKVEGLASRDAEVSTEERKRAAARARSYFQLASSHAWSAGGPALIACSGLAGSGKTTLAIELARATSFVRLSSDELRKRRAGIDPYRQAPPDAQAALYTPEARQATYQALIGEADRQLAAGRGVIVDATFLRRVDRALLAELARRHRCRHVFVECQADEAAVRARLAARPDEQAARAREGEIPVSDAGWEVYVAQRGERDVFGRDESHLVIDTTGSLPLSRAVAIRMLWRWRQGRPLE